MQGEYLKQVLRKLWPYLMNELISVLELKQGESLEREDLLIIEAIKLIMLLQSLNIEDFQMNQWMFIVDAYGMKKKNPNSRNLSLEKQGSKKSPLNNNLNDTQNDARTSTKLATLENPENFKTHLAKFIGNIEFTFFHVD